MRLLLWALSSGAVGFTVGLAVMAALAVRCRIDTPEGMTTRFGLLVTAATLLPMMAVTLTFVRRVDGRSLASFGLSVDASASWELLLGGALGGAATAGVFLAFVALGAATATGWTPELFRSNPVGFHRTFWGLLVLFAVQGAGEEILVRGYLLQSLLEVASPRVAVVVSSLLFGLAHGLNPAAQALGLLNIVLMGVVFAVTYLRTGRLWAAIGLHWMWNFCLGVVFSLPVSGFPLQGLIRVEVHKVHPWFTGGAFGPEGGMAGTVAVLLLLVAVISVFRPRVSVDPTPCAR